MNSFGEKIRKLRENKEYSQQYVASRLDMNQSNYSKIERGIQEPNLTQLKSLAEILGFSIDEILGTKQDNKNKDAELLQDLLRVIKKYN